MNVYELEKRATPGPWKCIDTSNHAHDYRLLRPSGETLPVSAPGLDHSEQRANAALLAHCRNNFMRALEALKEILDSAQSGHGVDEDGLEGLIDELEEVQ